MNSILKRTLQITLVVAVSGLIGEGCLRILSPMSEATTMSAQEVEATMGKGFRYDPDLIWYWKELPDEGAGVNRFGFRRTKAMEEKPPEQVTRVITLGDSQAFGGGVRLEQTFAHIAEEKLGEDWEIINAGLSGYRSLNVYRLLRLRLQHFDPDVLVVDCMPKDSPREFRPLQGKPLGNDPFGEWKWKSRLYYFSQLMLRVVGLRTWESLPWPLHLHQLRDQDSESDAMAYRSDPTLGNLDLIGNWAKNNDIEVVFMTYPFQESPQKVGCHTWEDALPNGFPVFDACAELMNHDTPASELFLDKNHLSPAGNRVVGEALSRFLGQELGASTAND